MSTDPTRILADLADTRDAMHDDGPPSLAELAAEVAVLEAAVVLLADTSPNREALRRWMNVASVEAEHDTYVGHAIRRAARRLAERLDEVGSGGPPWA